MALLVGELKSVLGLDTKSFDRNLDAAEAKFRRHGKQLETQAGSVAKKAGAGLSGIAGNAAKASDGIEKMSIAAGKAALAQDKHSAAVAKYGANSLQARTALLSMRQAQESLTQSNQRAAKSTDGAERSSFQLQGRLGRLGGVAGRASIGLGGIAKGAGIVGVAISATAGAVIGAGIKVTDYAGRLDLLKKKSATVFGGELGRVQTWAKANAHAMGLTKNEATGLAASFGDLLIPMGFTRKQAADMSTKMIGLSGALSEWSGGTKSAAEVSEILSAAMLGERDALQGLGISISQAEVEAKALELGLAKGAVNMNQVKAATLGLKEAQAKQAAELKEHGKGSLEYQKATVAVGTAQDRLAKVTKGSKAEISDQAAAIATQKLIMEKSKDAQTAFANGAGSIARNSAESRARLKEMGEILATKATPMLLKIGKAVNEDVLPALERFGGWLNDNRFKIALVFAEIGSAVTGLVKMFGPAIKFLNDAYMGWIANMLAGAAKAFGWVPEVGDKLKAASRSFDTYRSTTNTAFDAIINKAGDWDETLAKTKKELKLKADITDLQTKLNTAKTALGDKNLTKERRAKLNAEIASLQRQVNAAQTKVDSLHGKTVSVEIKFTSAGVNLTTPSSVGRKAMGGAIHGPGSGTSDQAGLYALSDDEHVITAREVRGAGGHAVVEATRRRWAKGLAKGGRAGGATFDSKFDAAIQRAARMYAGGFGPYGMALGFARSQAGKPYGWGSAGPGSYDCSGFMGAIANFIRGRSPYSRLGSTGTFPWSGFARGPGAFMIGSVRGNPGHMAGTLLGTNVESRGGDGVVVGRGARGAGNGLFRGNIWHLARLAAGGRAGDAPFDLFSPRGMHHGLLGKLLMARNGGWLRPGQFAYNETNRPERISTVDQLAAQRGPIVLEIRPGGSALDQVFITWLQKAVRTRGGGQVVFATGRA